jgi:uncharacterized protein YebE (UPF0316 family)
LRPTIPGIVLALIYTGVPSLGLPLGDLGIAWNRIPIEFLPLIIFLLRTFALTLATLRMLVIMRGNAPVAWLIGFTQSLSFILGVSGVLLNLYNPLNLLAYAAGSATGNVIGITIESKVAPGHSLLRIISPQRGNLITDRLRQSNRGVTEVSAQGISGMVSMIFCYVPRREVTFTKDQILNVDPQVFITVENVRQLRGGWHA